MNTLSPTPVPDTLEAPRLAGPKRPVGWRLQFVALRQEEMAAQTPLAELIARIRRTQGDEAATELIDTLADALLRAEGLRVAVPAAPAPLSDAESLNVAHWQREAEADLRNADAGVPTHTSKVVVELCTLVRRLNGEDAR